MSKPFNKGLGVRTADSDNLTLNSLERVVNSPVFIIGAQRSGTSWLQRLLLEHPNCVGGQESHLFSALGPLVNCNVSSRGAGIGAYFKPDEAIDLARDVWRMAFFPLIQSSTEPRILIEKTPDHTLWLDAIAKVFPKARFIHLIRDSRPVVASMLAASRDWGRHWAPQSARSAAVTWYRYTKAALDFKETGTHPVLQVHYERLRSNTAEELQNIFSFLDLDTTHQQIERFIEVNKLVTEGGSGNRELVSPVFGQVEDPIGFARHGSATAWKSELTYLQQLVVWRFTRRLMWRCGYNWRGLK